MLEAVMITAVRHSENEAKVQSEEPVPEVRALNEEIEPNKKFGKLLTILLT